MSVPTVTELLLARAGDERPGLRFEDETCSWAEHVRASARWAAGLRAALRRDEPPHVGILADNVPAFSVLLGACAFAGAVLVGLNPTRRGAALARDIRLADCQFVLTERKYRPLLAGLDLGGIGVRELESWAPPDDPAEPVPASADDLLMLIFTSGTSGDPKAVRCTHGKIAFPGAMLAQRFGLSTSDTAYVTMPMFHSNAVMAGWAVGLAAGATIALRRRFSASGFLPDVRRFGATYANYVGKPLSYVVATPPRPDDADNPLRLVYGNEGASADLAAFEKRFGCKVVDAFGSTEGGVGFARTDDTPPGSLGRPADDVAILHPDTGRRCPPAEFDADGHLVNAADAVGELVNTAGAGWFAGYYRDAQADAERLRDGRFHTGDLAYADAAGFCYFAGRLGDWLRVDGENLGTAPIERILLRHPAITDAAVYAVPDPVTGDQVMAAIVTGGTGLDPAGFGRFLVGQADLGPKQVPRYVRTVAQLPRTSTFKVLKRQLSAEGLHCADVLWERVGKDIAYADVVADPGRPHARI
ncbi:acyl-CoA synthetase [Amycolatopsis mediterranei S699]|uniref:Acyl-CoA synthetase n=3 Tax=Amycolatopsis mediterranei TaxID=33910 RepID=A0A0H3D845_AMYMU|nr:long-chain-fatty-acid--CoA ligase [Amycolatopsis mediterranei]ADJ45724.1 acyl-CoA synthetase [Amycolatopsis mediterranei U32]AEK42506.1 acyl-CoA synthetase [Amycolatopsis mediterranei S699]AFO77435.1 acyl-CoA synthetase [Amycolatopsis mediterranei S699]KDO05771.1 acyl-CoA synthetase [Amycolatopsis mediterranei]KDU88356.1 acyl-CoA synthetase [Amycolatopsis mediterranei]